jgi:hypothetical protein
MLINEAERREANEAAQEAKKIEATKERTSEAFIIGVDLGQSYDFTAIVGVERVKITTFDKWRESKTKKVDLNAPRSELEPVFNTSREYHVRLIERVRLGTSYAEIIKYLLNLVERPVIKEKKPVIAIDASGVGRAVFDMAREAGLKDVKAITATGGEKITDDDPYFNVPKSELASLVKGLFGRGILKIAKGLKESDALTRELENYMVKRTDAGRAQFEAAPSSHDDLVAALSLACFIADRYESIPLVAPIEIRKAHNDGLRYVNRPKRGAFSMSNKTRYY